MTATTIEIDAVAANPASHPVLDVRDVTKVYGQGETAVHALQGVSMTVQRGEYVAIMGSSGSGKSTLMNILGCLDIPTTGEYLLDGVDVSRLTDRQLALVRNRRIGFVFQSFNLIPRTTALANVELPLAYAGMKAADRRARARAALAMVGLADREGHEPNQLSGGQQQRVAVARALVTAPALVLADEPTGNLDTQSTSDMLSVLDRLNRGGRTIVLITHEDDVARHARRLIRLVDGKIVSDVRQDRLDPAVWQRPDGEAGPVSIFETIRFALRGISANKLRSGLTVLGILIGVAAVILLVAVGNGSAKAVQDQIEGLGTNTLTVTSGNVRQAGVQTHNTSLTLDMVTALNDHDAAPDVKTASPVVSGSQDLVYDGTDHTVNEFVGTYPGYVPASNYTVATGSPFTLEDVASGRRVLLIGSTVDEALFPGIDAVGKQITVSGTLFTVVGVLAEKGGSGFNDPNDIAIAPVSAVQEALTGYGPLNQILIQATTPDAVSAAQTEVSAILDQKLHVTGTEPYRILNQAQLLQARASTAETFTLLLGAVAGISLLVGGIGITNIMMVTVTERTREIGIRKALGAPKRTVLTQFLVEATVLSVMGGLLGVLAAVIGSQFKIAGVVPVIVPGTVALALGVSVAIGLFFGSYPASRAASLRPIEALRYE